MLQRILLWIIVAGLVLIGVILYQRSRTSVNRLDVDPGAAEEIEKARRR